MYCFAVALALHLACKTKLRDSRLDSRLDLDNLISDSEPGVDAANASGLSTGLEAETAPSDLSFIVPEIVLHDHFHVFFSILTFFLALSSGSASTALAESGRYLDGRDTPRS